MAAQTCRLRNDAYGVPAIPPSGKGLTVRWNAWRETLFTALSVLQIDSRHRLSYTVSKWPLLWNIPTWGIMQQNCSLTS